MAGIKGKRRLVPMEFVTDYLGVSKATVRNYVKNGLLPMYRIGPRNVRFDADDIEALVQPATRAEAS